MEITRTHIATKENPAGTEAWIVESQRDLNNIRYWAGYFFTDDVEEAVQFRRHKDGQKLVDEQFSQWKAYFCVRHKWL